MELFRTRIEPAPLFDHTLDWESRFFSLGSCFAQGMADTLQPLGFHVYHNPYGTIYNPLSTANVLRHCITKKQWLQEDLLLHEDKLLSLHHHGSINCALANLNAIERQNSSELQKSQILIITHGTAWVYFLKSSQEAISNCHRLPAALFERRLMSVDQLYRIWAELIPQLQELNPDLKICFTVSPVRHLRDNFRANQISKSTLHLFTERLCSDFGSCEYFPSYEIMMDELRDYRFYEADMCHPNKTAINYITEQFFTAAFQPGINDYLSQARKIASMNAHRTSDSQATLALSDKIKQRIRQLQQSYPGCFPGADV